MEDKVKAAQQLAIQDWKFFRVYEDALAMVKEADALGIKQSITGRILGRIARGKGDYLEAQNAAKKALETAESVSDKQNSQILLAYAIHDQAIQNRLQGKELDQPLLNEAHLILTNVIAAKPGHPTASKLLFGISLLRRDGPTALKAWRNYFFIPAQEAATGLLAEPYNTLDRILPKWQGITLSTNDQESLVLTLAQSRFYRYVSIAATDLQLRPGYEIENHPAIKEIVLYADLIKWIKQTTDEYYRRFAINKQKGSLVKNYRNSFWKEAERFWIQLSFTGEKPKFKKKRFLAEIDERFCAELMGSGPIRTSSYDLALTMGHRIVDDSIEVEQYGHKAKIHFIVLDSIVSNNYSGWFWDGRAVPAGWTIESKIVQI